MPASKKALGVEKDRLVSLIEFCRQSALLRRNPAAAVAAQGRFVLHEHEIQGLPSIRINVSDPDSEDEVWLAIERLHETRPPDVASAVLRPWILMTQGPAEEPQLLERTDGAALIAAGTHCSSGNVPDDGKPVIDPEATIEFSGYEQAGLVHASFKTHLTKWRLWADGEKRRRKTIRLYSELFTLNDGVGQGYPDRVSSDGLRPARLT